MKENIRFSKKKLMCMVSIVILLVGIFLYVVISLKDNDSDIFKRLDRYDLQDDYSEEINNGESAKYFKLNDVHCDSFKDAVVAYDEYFIANENGNTNVYRYNIEKKFSNDENCILISKGDDYISLIKSPKSITSNKFIYVFSDKTGENQVPYYTNDYIDVYNSEEITDTQSIASYTLALVYYTVDSFVNHHFDPNYPLEKTPFPIYQVAGSRGIITNNSTVIKQVILDNVILGIYEPKVNEQILFQVEDNDERIIKVFDYAIITNKKVYTYGIIDNSCFDYVEKECIRGFKVNQDLTKRIDDISFVDELYIVFKNGKSYMYQSYEE